MMIFHGLFSTMGVMSTSSFSSGADKERIGYATASSLRRSTRISLVRLELAKRNLSQGLISAVGDGRG
jgi:hypothetical protein